MNFVIFGPAHVGKSTCAGYVIRQNLTEHEFGQELKKAVIDKGKDYDIVSNKYACLVDKGLDEGMPNKVETQGTSLVMHINNVQLSSELDINIIDTPGFSHKTSERAKGISYGEFGLFMIEINKIMEICLDTIDSMRLIYERLRYLSQWILDHDAKKLIIVVSKMDEAGYDFSEHDFLLAKDYLLSYVGTEVPVIPISIDVANECDENVISKGKNMPWYTGQTLQESIIALARQLNEVPKDTVINKQPLLMSCPELFKNPKRSGPKLRGKIMSGELRVGDRVKILPIDGEAALGRILSIEQPGLLPKKGKSVESAYPDQIIGINLSSSNAQYEALIKSKKRKKLDAICITNASTKCCIGTLARFRADIGFWDKCKNGGTVGLRWFSKDINGVVLGKYAKENNYYLIVELPKPLAMPFSNEGFILKDFFIYVPEVLNKEKELICPQEESVASLDKLGYPSEVYFDYIVKSQGNIDEKMERIVQNKGCFYQRTSESQILLYGCDQLNPLLSSIRKGFSRLNSELGPNDCKIRIAVKIV